MLSRRTFTHAVLGCAALGALPRPSMASAATTLERVLAFDTVVNAVATTPAGDVFVGFPHLTGEAGTKVARMQGGEPVPFPDQEWNAWQPGLDASRHVVRLNALRIGPDGLLWVVDVGASAFDTEVVPGGPKILSFDPASGRLDRAYPIEAPAISTKSYIDDIRFNGRQAYVTDAGVPGLILLDLDTGATRRVLDHHWSTTDLRPMYAKGRLLTKPDGSEVRIHADQLEVSPDGHYLYFMPSSGPLHRIETAALADPTLTTDELAQHVTPFAEVPTTGGTAIAADGTIYVSDTNRSRILTVSAAGKVDTLIEDPRLDWPDAMWIDSRGDLWIPAAQINRTPVMNGGKDDLRRPVEVLRMHIGARPSPIDHA